MRHVPSYLDFSGDSCKLSFGWSSVVLPVRLTLLQGMKFDEKLVLLAYISWHKTNTSQKFLFCFATAFPYLLLLPRTSFHF